jgi:FkbM family methyltransferase
MNFTEELIKEIIANMDHNYTDNYDHYRFGPEQHPTTNIKTLAQYFVQQLNKRNYFNVAAYKKDLGKLIGKRLDAHPKAVENCGKLFNLLSDENSKELLIKLLAYALMGHTKVKLPLSNPEYWKEISEIELGMDKSDSIATGFLDFTLYKINLQKWGFPINFYYTAMGIMTTFIVKQYEYRSGNTVVKAENGDVVIDAGACWGDTALYFASQVGPTGSVYSFEFIPTNLKILGTNVALNPSLAKTIRVVESPLWDVTGKPVFYFDNGPGSKVSFEKESNLTGETTTLTIDDWADGVNLSKLDFIKMDIEGAEMSALYGAERTISKFKPKLAICIYHQWEDFSRIAEWLANLGLGYKFYITHNTINLEETVLFAKP